MLKIKRLGINDVFIIAVQLFIIGVFARTNINFGVTFLSLQNFLIIIFLPVLLLYLFNKTEAIVHTFFLIFIGVFLMMVFYLFSLYRNVEQFKDFFYLSS